MALQIPEGTDEPRTLDKIAGYTPNLIRSVGDALIAVSGQPEEDKYLDAVLKLIKVCNKRIEEARRR